jgi:hypothetical protein
MSRNSLPLPHHRSLTMLLSLLFCFGNAQAAGYPEAALSGLDGIEVSIASPGEDAEKAGLTKAHLAAVVSQRLLKTGVPILGFLSGQRGNPYLYIIVSTLKHEDLPIFFYTVKVNLNQDVVIQRARPSSDGQLPVLEAAVTGSNSTMGYAGEHVFVDAVTKIVEEYVDRFAIDYLKNKNTELTLALIEAEKKAALPKPFDPHESANSIDPDASDKSTVKQPAASPVQQPPKGTAAK